MKAARAMRSCLFAVAAMLACGACAGGSEAPASPVQEPAAAPSPVAKRELVVFAAASLREAFTAVGKDLERAQPGLAITFNFAGTQELRTQLEHGAVADVFAAADSRHMDELLRAGRVAAPVVFTRNEPVVIVSKEAAATLRSFSDLPGAERIVIGSPEVPIGRYAVQVLDRASGTLGEDFRARVEAKVVSRELSVKHVLAKVRFGEAQAGVVYRSDAEGVPDVSVVAIPAELNVIAEYPIAVVSGAPHAEAARAFVERVRSEAGQATLQRAGFLPAAAAAGH